MSDSDSDIAPPPPSGPPPSSDTKSGSSSGSSSKHKSRERDRERGKERKHRHNNKEKEELARSPSRRKKSHDELASPRRRRHGNESDDKPSGRRPSASRRRDKEQPLRNSGEQLLSRSRDKSRSNRKGGSAIVTKDELKSRAPDPETERTNSDSSQADTAPLSPRSQPSSPPPAVAPRHTSAEPFGKPPVVKMKTALSFTSPPSAPPPKTTSPRAIGSELIALTPSSPVSGSSDCAVCSLIDNAMQTTAHIDGKAAPVCQQCSDTYSNAQQELSSKIPPLNDEEFSKSVAEIANSRRSALASMKLSKEQQLTDDEKNAQKTCLRELSADVVVLQLLLNNKTDSNNNNNNNNNDNDVVDEAQQKILALQEQQKKAVAQRKGTVIPSSEPPIPKLGPNPSPEEYKTFMRQKYDREKWENEQIRKNNPPSTSSAPTTPAKPTTKTAKPSTPQAKATQTPPNANLRKSRGLGFGRKIRFFGKNQPKSKQPIITEKTTPTFGVTIKEAVQYAKGQGDGLVPLPLLHAFDIMLAREFTSAEGIFRLTGSIAVINQVKDLYDRDGATKALTILQHERNPHTVAGVAKLWLRECPERIIPNDLINVTVPPTPRDRVVTCIEIKQKMPAENLACLRSLCMVLNEVWQNREQSMMGIRNLSVVFGPLVTGMGKQSELMTTFIEHYRVVFSSDALPDDYLVEVEEVNVEDDEELDALALAASEASEQKAFEAHASQRYGLVAGNDDEEALYDDEQYYDEQYYDEQGYEEGAYDEAAYDEAGYDYDAEAGYDENANEQYAEEEPAAVISEYDDVTDVEALRTAMNDAMAAQDFERCVVLRERLIQLGAL